MMSAGFEGSAEGGGHQRVHADKAERKRCQAEHAARGAAEIGGQEEQGELAGGLGADSVKNADDEYGFAVVHPLEALGLWSRGIPGTADAPAEPQHAVDGDGEAALDAAMAMAVRVLAQDAGDDADAEDDERKADEALGPVIESFGQSHMQLQDSNTEGGDGEGMAECVGHPEAQAAPPVALDGGDVRDGGEVIVVEAVPEAQHKAGTESGIEFPVAQNRCHRCLV